LLGLQVNNQGYRRVDYGASTPVGEGGLRISGYSMQRDGGWQDYDSAKKNSITLRHDMPVGNSALLKTILSYNHLHTDMPGGLNETDFKNRPGFSYNTFTWRDAESMRLSSELEGSWNTGGLSTITAYARSNKTDQLPSYLIFNTGAATAAGRTTSNHFQSLGFDAHHRQDLGVNTRLLLGINIESTPMKARDVNLSIVRDPATGRYLSYTTGSVRRDYDVDISSQALYAQIEYQINPVLKIQGGGRYDHIAFDYHNHLTPSAVTGAASEKRSYQHFSPKLGAVYSPDAQWSWFGNLSQGFTPPEVSSQYGASLSVPNLIPSVFNNMDMGLRWLSTDKTHSAELSFYRLDGKNEQVSYNIAPGVSEPRNAGRTRHQGIEFGYKWQPSQSAWDAKINGAWASHRYEKYQVSPTLVYDGNLIPAAPRLMANAELGYRILPQWRVSAELQKLGRYWMDSANTVRYPGHHILNLRTSYKTGPWELWASLQNATGKKYAEIASSSYSGVGVYDPNKQNSYNPGAPRTLLMGLRYNFGAAQ
jgi:outer membrane receptor protein involved in Fe transport